MSDDRLRALLDPRDLDGSEGRLRAALAAEMADEGRAEVLTQLARLASWRDRFDDAYALLDEAGGLAGESGVARARVLLERGRVAVHTDGNEAGLPLLEEAFDVALAADQHFVAADAAHSCALRGDMELWTARGLEVADRFEAARYWRGTLLINLGDWHWERGELERSLATFEAALAAREQETRNPSLTEEARHGVARALRALGRPAEAVPLLEQVVCWVDKTGFEFPEARDWREELAAARAAVRQDARMVPEAPLERTEVGLVPNGAGWFVLNAREARWYHADGRPAICDFEGRTDFAQVGVNVSVLQPGQPMAMYHREADQEDFLVVSGDAVLVIEGEERPLRAWDFVHCPPHTGHTIVGAGDGPCVVVAIGAREHQDGADWGAYPVDEAAARHGASVEQETAVPAEAYAGLTRREPTAYRDWLGN